MKYFLLFTLFLRIHSEENCLTLQECQDFVNTYPLDGLTSFLSQDNSCIYTEGSDNYCITKCTSHHCDDLIKFGRPFIQNYYAKPIGIITPTSPPSPLDSQICYNESIPIRNFFQNMLQTLGLVISY